MGNIWKRSLSMFLAVILVVGMLPVNAFAAEGEVTEVTEAVETTAPETTEAPAETQAPAETEAPAQTEAPATEAPTETEAPKETEAPVETTVPAETQGAVIVSGDSSSVGAVQATTTTLENKDTGTISIDALNNDSISTPSWWGHAGNRYRVKNSDSDWTRVATGQSVTLSHGETYEVQEWYTRLVDNKYSESYYVTFNIYHEVTASLHANTEAQGTVTVANGGKVYTGSTTTLTVSKVDGYNAEIYSGDTRVATLTEETGWTYTTAAITASGAYTVKYVAASTPTKAVSKDVTGGDFGTVDMTTGDVNVGDEVTVTLTPNAANRYVAAVSAEGAALTGSFDEDGVYTGKFTVGENDVKVTVTFAEMAVAESSETAPIKVAFNGHESVGVAGQMEGGSYTANGEDKLETVIYNALVNGVKPDALDYENVKIEYLAMNEHQTLSKVKSVWSELDVVPANDKGNTGYGDYAYYAFANDSVGDIEQVRLTWPGDATHPKVVVEAYIELVEGRPEAEITVGTVADVNTYANKQTVIDAVKTAGVSTTGGELSYAVGDLPAVGSAGQVSVTITSAANTNCKETTKTIYVTVTNLAAPADITLVNGANGTVVLTDAAGDAITGTVGNTVTGTATAGTVTVVATPNEGYYVASVAVDGNPVTGTYSENVLTASFTVENEMDYKVEVTFVQYTLNAASGSMAVNGFDNSTKTSNLKLKVLTAALGETVVNAEGFNADNYTVEMSIAVFGYTEVSNALIGPAMDMGEAESFRINQKATDKYPAVSTEVSLTLMESRQAPVIDQVIEKLTTDTLPADGSSWFTVKDVDGNSVAYTVDISSITELPGEGANKDYFVTVSVANNEKTLAASENKTINITNPVYNVKVNFAQPTGAVVTIVNKDTGAEVESGDKVAAGTYTIQAAPSGCYYVTGINGIDGLNTTDATWTKTNYAIDVTLEAAAEDGKEYTFTVNTAERKINVNLTIPAVSYNKETQTFADIKGAVYSAIVAGSAPEGIALADCDVTFNGTNLTLNAANSFTVTWKATEKYPAASVTANVTLTEARQKAIITVSETPVVLELDDAIAQENQLTELVAAINAAKAVSVSEGASELTYELNSSVTMPKQGGETNVTLTINCAENDKYLAADQKTITVTLKGKVEKSNVSLSVGEGGTLTGLTNGVMDPNTYEVKAAPSTGYYIDSITVDGTPLNVTTLEHSWNQEIKDGTGLALGEVKNYKVAVTFAEAALNAHNGTVTINKYLAKTMDAKALATLKADILTAAGLDRNGAYTVTTSVGYNSISVNVEITADGKAIVVDDPDTFLDNMIAGQDVAYLLAPAMSNDTTRSFTISHAQSGKMPAMSETVTMTIADTRIAPVIEQKTTELSVEEVPTDGKSWFYVTTESGIRLDEYVTVDISAVQLPANGETKSYTVKVSVADNEYATAVTNKEYQISVTNPAYGAKVTIKQPTGAVITAHLNEDSDVTVKDGDTVDGGTYAVLVTPDTEQGYYVDSITAKGAEVQTNNQLWNDGVYNVMVNIPSGEKEINNVTIEAKVGKREIQKNTTINAVTWTSDLKDEDVLKAVFNAVVANTDKVPYGECTVECLSEGGLGVGEKTFKITWNGNEQYPSVSVEAAVTLSNDLNIEADSDGAAVSGAVTESFVFEQIDLAIPEGAADPVMEIISIDGKEDAKIEDLILVQGQTATIKVKITVPGNGKFAGTETTVTVPITGEVKAADVKVVSNIADAIDHLEVKDEYANGLHKYTFTLKEVDGYVLDTLKFVWKHATGRVFTETTPVTLALEDETDGGEITFTGKDFVDGKLIVYVADGTGEALSTVPAYTATATFVQPGITIPATGTMNYYVGMLSTPEALNAKVLEALENAGGITYAPADLEETGTTEILYKAREQGTYTYSVTIDLPVLGIKTFDLPVTMPEMWKPIGSSFDAEVKEPTNEEIQEFVSELLKKYSFSELMAMANNTDKLKQILAEELENAEEFAAFYTNYGAHKFGEQETETVKLTVGAEDTKYGEVESNTSELTLTDTRIATSIALAEGVEMTYGFTEAELMAALGGAVTGENGTALGTAKLVTDVKGMGASTEPQTIKLEYAGNDQYKNCSAETTIIVNKAPVDVQVDNRRMKWQEGLTYDLPVVTDPAGVDVITFIVGLDVADMNIDNNSLVGLNGEIILLIPDELQGLLNPIFGADGADTTLAELKDALLAIAEVQGWTGSADETVQTLLSMLESLDTNVLNMTVRLGGGLPTDVGAYIVGAVSADANYTTDFGAGAIVIYPNGMKAELDWKYGDDNGIVHKDVLANVPDYLDAQVVKVHEGSIEEAQKEVIELFFGVTVNVSGEPKIVVTADPAALAIGAYTEIGMISNFGNEMYYAVPIMRGVVVVPETVTVEIIDENGEVNRDRRFTYDRNQHGVDVRVTSTMGNVNIDTSKGDTSNNLTVTYIGVQTNAEAYNSTTPPTRTGVYSVVATYMETNGDEITLFGADAGVLTIEPAESYVEVENKLYKYDGKGVTTADMVKAYSTVVGEPAPTTTVITAALATDGTFSENAFAAIDGIVNVDFPVWLDNYLKQIPALAGAYTEAGLDITKFYEYADELEALLAEVNIETDIVTKIVETLQQMHNDVKLTFKEQADVAPSAVGTYLVAGIVTDPDHYPSIGAALLVIYPDVIEADLQWRAEDVNDNHVFKLDTVVNKVIDLGADAYLGGAYNQELSNITKTLYLGVDADNWKVNLVVDDQTKLTNGVYTEIAYLVKLDSVAYYAVPIQRTFVIAPESVTVQFVDKLDENNERHFVYDGTAKKMDVLVKEGSTTLADTRVAANENLTITYVGVQTNGKVYNSTEAPVHAGTYEVVATYAERENGKLVNFGAAVGIMVIEPTTASIEVESKAVPVGTTVKLSDLITVKSPVAGETPDTTIITAQIATDGDFSDKGVLALDGNVNVDFPKWLDDILVKIDALDPAYNGTGLGTASFLENLQKIKTVLTDLGVDTQILDKLVTLLEQMPGANLTFNDQESVAYTAVGSYLVIGVVTDSDYYPAMDAGILTIYPNVALGELQWIREDSNNIYYLETLKTIDLGAKALFGGVEDSSVDPSELYLGINTETWEITLTDDQTELKEGVYTEIAYLNDTDANAHYAAPIVRPVIITDSIYPVVFIDENGNVNHERLFTYDGTPKSIGVATVRGTNINENNVPAGDTLKVVYIGTDSVGNPYNSETAPTDAGVYTVIATYATTNEDGEPAGGVGIGAVVIKKADLALDMKDTTVTYDGKGHFVDVTSNNEKADYLTVIVDKQNNVANIILEDDLTIAGGAVKTLLEKALGRSLDNEFSVTEVQQALHKVIDSIQAIEIPAEVKSMVNQLPDEMQQALKDMTMPVKDKLAEALQKQEDAMPVSGTVIFNGDLPVDAGKYEFYGFAISENYEPEATQGILTIEPVEVKVVLNSCEKFYGEEDPELGYTVEYPEGTTVRTDITVTELKRAEGEDVGEYAITAKAAAKDDKNFKVEVVSGKLTIKPAEITITVESAEKTYADEDPAVKYTFTVNNGKVTEEEIELSITRKDGNNAGDYDYVVNYKESDNWVVTVEETGKLTIKPIKLTVNVDDQEMFVGDVMPELTYTVDGVLEGETLALTIKVSTEADGKTAGEYKITATVEGSDPNYVVETVNEGTLTVKAKEETPDESGNTTFPEGKIPDNLYIDGKPVEKDEDGNFIIDNEVYGEKILATSYDFKNEESNNPHKVYPEHMYVWELTWDNEKEKYDAAEISALYDLLMYEGASIRVNDSYDAIRFISSIDPTTRSTLEKQGNTLLKGTILEGYYMVEAGTLFKFYAGEGDYTNWNTASNVSFVYGGTLNEPFRVFATANGRNWFTGPLTLANATAEKLYNDVLSRPYVTLANAQGEEITLYGGEIQRSVYYVAVMNHATWNAGTAYDNYVEKLIATVEDAGYTKINRP